MKVHKIPYSPKTELHLKDVQISKAKNNLSTKLNATERRTINLKNPIRDITYYIYVYIHI